MSLRSGACALLLIVVVAAAASAQTYQGAVRGAVTDAQGIIPGVDVSLVNEATNAARTVVTNDAGEYVFASVLPGVYTLRAALAGFRTEERKGIRVTTQQQLTLDFTMAVGAISEQITVTGDAPMVEKATATVATAMDAEQIAAMPIFGRNTFYSSIQTPNVIQSGDPQFVRYQDQTNASYLSLGGGPRRGNAYLLEGVSITDFLNRPSWVPSTESLEDMRVQVKTYDADMGRAAGGVFNVTAKSGSNTWHGSALFLNKPNWSTGNLFFAERAGTPKPDQFYYSWAGSVGGPIRRDQTFFWFSKDDYKQLSTRNNVLTFPTAAERAGDFSQTRNAAGQPVVIYDPLTTRTVNGQVVRDAFTGNVIPANRVNPIAAAILAGMPLPTSGKSFVGNATIDDGPQRQETLKIDHRWNERWTTTGMYGHQYTSEPGNDFWGELGTMPGDPGASLLYRSINFYSVNNIFIPNNSTTVAVRYGYNRFKDDGNNYVEFDAGSLGFPPNFVDALGYNTFPRMVLTGYGSGGTNATVGNNGPSIVIHVGQSANATLSKFFGRHTMKVGVDYRRIEAQTMVFGSSAGDFTFNQQFTQLNPNTASTTAGDSIASFLLGYPASGSITSATPGVNFVDYIAGYVQDDFRLNARLTVNYGIRYEFEQGMREQDNQITVGFNQDAVLPVQVPGLDLRGGLMYAGVDGNPTHQGQPINGFAPRGGVAYSITESLVLRGGYGFFNVPTQFAGTTEAALGTRGYTASTSYLATNDSFQTPANSISNPFPNGVEAPVGNARGLLTGVGGAVDFIDQDSKPGYVQQYSIDLQKEFAGGNVLGIGYMGSRSEHLSVGGTADATVNLNQLDPQYLALGTQLQQLVTNPFFGNTAFGNLSLSPTITRGQLLRPFPQFTDVLAHRVNAASARYNALVTRWSKRMADGYSLDVNYTFSNLEDNQFGETNSFSSRQGNAVDNYDIDGEWGVSLLDVKHRLNLNASFELPFGDGRKWLNGGGVSHALLGGWQITLAGRYQTGFPLNISQSVNNSNLLGSNQRPNIVEGTDAMTAGSQEDRAVTGWINPAAFTAAPAFTFGNAPRTRDDWRGPSQRNIDLAIGKTQRIGGKTVSVRADIQNLFDDPLFNGPVTTFGTATFGQIQAVGGFARSTQFQVRFGF